MAVVAEVVAVRRLVGAVMPGRDSPVGLDRNRFALTGVARPSSMASGNIVVRQSYANASMESQ